MPLTLDELENIHTDESVEKETDRIETIPSGRYKFQADRWSGWEDEESGRPLISFKGPVFHPETNDNGGRLRFVTSPKEGRTNSGRMDREASVWSHYRKALHVEDSAASSVVEAALQFPVMLSVQETFVVEDADTGAVEYRSPKTADERTAFLKAGYRAFNRVGRVWEVK